MPDAIANKCDALGREYLMIVEVAMECDYNKALQAIYAEYGSYKLAQIDSILNKYLYNRS